MEDDMVSAEEMAPERLLFYDFYPCQWPKPYDLVPIQFRLIYHFSCPQKRVSLFSSGQLHVPAGVSVLHVEQEIDGDDTLVLEAVLASDNRRHALLDEEKRLMAELQPLGFCECPLLNHPRFGGVDATI